jgi:hypothetical protein
VLAVAVLRGKMGKMVFSVAAVQVAYSIRAQLELVAQAATATSHSSGSTPHCYKKRSDINGQILLADRKL